MSKKMGLHSVILVDKKGKSDPYEVVYSDLENMKFDLVEVFKKGNHYDVFFELDEDILELEQYIELMNLNPYLPDISNVDNCSTISEFKKWLSDYELLIDASMKLGNC